jgi:ABC-type nitrate/sulfonate/bicarbonate transport system substrate-binding protein
MRIPRHEPEKIWYTRSPVPTPLGLASQLGWFLDEFRDAGIGVYSRPERDEVHLRAASPNPHLVKSFRQGGSVQAIWARAAGGATRVIGLNWLDEYQAILVRADSDIHRPEQLAGRRLGLPRRSNVDVYADRPAALRAFTVVLEMAGIAERNVEFVDVHIDTSPVLCRPGFGVPSFGALQEVAAALKSGRVDAVFVKGALGAKIADEIRARTLLDIRTHPDPLVRANHGVPRPLTVSQSLLDEAPDVVLRFLSRVVDVGEWAAAHPDETLSYFAREAGAEEHWIRLAYGSDVHLHQRTTLDDTAVAALSHYKQFLFDRGFIPENFALSDWIHPGPLQQLHTPTTRVQSGR